MGEGGGVAEQGCGWVGQSRACKIGAQAPCDVGDVCLCDGGVV